jgi:hypothetical protein
LGGFLADFRSFLLHERADGLERSLVRQAAELAGELRDQVRLTLRADELRAGSDAARVEAFHSRLDATGQRRRDAADLAIVQRRHLVDELNSGARQAVDDLRAHLTRQLDQLLSGPLAQASVDEIYVQGREAIRTSATARAEAWRGERAAILQREIDELDGRLRARLDRDQAGVRDAAWDLLGVEISVPSASVRLIMDPRFHYAPWAPEGPTEAVAAAVRRLLPGRYGRERMLRYLEAEASEMADRQIGRARADLQFRLEETIRALIAAVSGRYEQYGARLSHALRAAEELRTLTEGQASEQRTALAEREQDLGALFERLTVLDNEARSALAREGGAA